MKVSCQRMPSRTPPLHTVSAISAEAHHLFYGDRAGQDDIGALRLEAPDVPAPAHGERLDALAQSRDVREREAQRMALASGTGLSREVHAGQRAHRAAEPEELVAPAGRG